LSQAGFATGLIAKDGGWGSEKMVITYNRTQAVRDGAMAQWFRARGAWRVRLEGAQRYRRALIT
jgi:hypothetical protein